MVQQNEGLLRKTNRPIFFFLTFLMLFGSLGFLWISPFSQVKAATWDGVVVDNNVYNHATPYGANYEDLTIVDSTGRIWAFFKDSPAGANNNFVYSSSGDNGLTWEASVLCGQTTGSSFYNSIDVVYDNSTGIDYVHIAYSQNQGDIIYYRRGTLRDPTDVDISWTVVDNTGVDCDSKHWIDINLDSEGYPWIAYFEECVGSSTKDGTWSTNGSRTKTGLSNALGVILPVDDDGSMLWIEKRTNAATVVGSWLWNGSTHAWGNAGAVSTVDLAISTTYVQLDAINDDDYGVHCVYLAVPPNGLVYRYRYPNGTWATEETIYASGGGFPSITRIKSAQQIYVFWSGGTGDDCLYYKRRSSVGVWGSATLLSNQTTDELQYDSVHSSDYEDDDGYIEISFRTLTAGGGNAQFKVIRRHYSDPPILDHAWITDMEGCGAWLFAEEQYYHFRMNVTIEPSYILDTAKIRFTDGFSTIQMVAEYNSTYGNSFYLENGSKVAIVSRGTITNVSTVWTITIACFLKYGIFDAYDVDIYCYAKDSIGGEAPFELLESDYFNIYNLGGLATYDTTGSSGRTVGGDIFELYAGGLYGGLILEDNFDSSMEFLHQWTPYDYSDEAVGNIIEIRNFPFHSPVNAANMQDGAAGTPTPYIDLLFGQQSSNFSLQIQIYSWDNTQGQSTIKLLDTMGVSQGDVAVVRLGYLSGFDGFFVDNATDTFWINANFSAQIFHNVTFVVDVTNDLYDVYIDEVLKADDVPHVTDNIIDTLRIQAVFGTAIKYIVFDSVVIWRGSTGNVGGNATATQIWRKFQHVHTLFALGIPDGDDEISDPNEGFVEFGIDYCYNDVWIENGWKVRINITDARLEGKFLGFFGEPANWVELNVTWYNRGTPVKSDLLYALWEGSGSYGLSQSADYVRLWVDLWFNRVNASTTVGGRVNAYYYGMHETAFHWLWGTTWSPMIEQVSSSMYFHNLEDQYGNVISVRELELFRVRGSVVRTDNYDYRWVLRDFDIYNKKTVPPQQRMVGIDTPTFVPTQTPNMGSGGFFASLISAISAIGNEIIEALTFSALEVWDIFVLFLDTVFTSVGWSNGFTILLSWISSFKDWLIIGVTYLIQMLTSTFTLISTYFEVFIVQFLNITSVFIAIFEALQFIWLTLTVVYSEISVWVNMMMPLAALGLFIWIFSVSSTEAMIGRVMILWNLLRTFIGFLIQIATFIINIITSLIETIPVVE